MKARSTEIAILVIISALFGVLYALTPLHCDDLWYLVKAKAYSDQPWMAFHATVDECVRHLSFDTGRLSNLLSPPFLCLLPKWVFSLITVFVIFFTLRIGYSLARGKNPAVQFFLYLILYVLALPWYDYMLSIIFALNYVWPSLMGIGCAWLCFNSSRWEDRGLLCKIGVCILFYLTGWIHEGLSVPLLSGLFFYLVISKSYKATNLIAAYLLLILGFVTILMFPGLWNRSGEGAAFKLFSLPIKEMLIYLIAFNCMFFAYLALLAFYWKIIKHNRQQQAIAAFYLIFGLVSTLIFIVFYGGPRVGWYNQLFCGIGSLWLLGKTDLRLSTVIVKVFGWVTALFLALHLGYAIFIEAQLNQEMKQLIALAKSTADGRVYYDQLKPKLDLSLFKTSIRAMNDPHTLKEFEIYYVDDDKDFQLLPASAKTAPSQHCNGD